MQWWRACVLWSLHCVLDILEVHLDVWAGNRYGCVYSTSTLKKEIALDRYIPQIIINIQYNQPFLQPPSYQMAPFPKSWSRQLERNSKKTWTIPFQDNLEIPWIPPQLHTTPKAENQVRSDQAAGTIYREFTEPSRDQTPVKSVGQYLSLVQTPTSQ